MRILITLILAFAIITTPHHGYSHSGETNSAGCHRMTADNSFHCHNRGDEADLEKALIGLAVLAIIIIVIRRLKEHKEKKKKEREHKRQERLN